jgi:hypothetical protein
MNVEFDIINPTTIGIDEKYRQLMQEDGKSILFTFCGDSGDIVNCNILENIEIIQTSDLLSNNIDHGNFLAWRGDICNALPRFSRCGEIKFCNLDRWGVNIIWKQH